MRKFHDILLGCIIAGSISTCTDLNLAGGGLDTETSGGTVVGLLTAEDGTPEKYARVFCVPSSYNALKDPQLSDSLINATDETGHYRFDRVKKGGYNIQAASLDKKTNVLICGINVGKDTITVLGGTLHPSGTLKIIFPDAVNGASGYYYLPGTTFFTLIQNGFAVMSDVPSGFVPAVDYFDTRDSSKNHVVKTGFFISPDDTTVITDLVPWKFSKKLFLNTTVTGADITGNVFNFPVLVRLTSSNFDFARDVAGGGDLRFIKSDNTPLPYEIERWDRVTELAEVWVKIDTVYGNDSSQYFTMWWGNPNAVSASNGEAVFDTTEGFLGVWHLGGSGNANASDATLHHYDGTPTDTAPQAIPGIIGDALQFDGNANGLIMKNTAHSPLNFPRPGTYTFSTWVYVDTVYDADEFIAGKGYDQYSLRVKGSKSYPSNLFALHEYVDAPIYGTEMRIAPVVVQQWKYIVGIRDTTNSYLFIDGRCVDSSGAIFYSKGDVQDSTNFSIGRCGASYPAPPNSNNYLAFKGKIDEVRIANVACTADWVKLSYMNQKQQDALVQFK
jgi:hypothetical protein